MSEHFKGSVATHASTERHRLSNTDHGESAIELLAQRIETRRENRIPIPHSIRKKILQEFYKKSKKEGYSDSNRIHYEDLVSLKEKNENQSSSIPWFLWLLGFIDEKELKRKIFERAERVITESEMKDEGWFYYRDFMVS